MEFVTFLTGSSVAAVVIIQLIKKYIKNVLMPRWGQLGVLAALFVISLLLAGGGYLVQFLPGNVLLVAGQIAGGSIVIYQVLWKAIIQKAVLDKKSPGTSLNGEPTE